MDAVPVEAGDEESRKRGRDESGESEEAESSADAKKAKTNAMFGKKIIMAVKQGGSPDPNANRSLADVIKQAKANSVPVDVSTRIELVCDSFIFNFRLICKNIF